MSEWLELAYQRVAALLLLLEAVSVFLLWSLDPVGRLGVTVFALFLALNLVAFSMISYVYRKPKMGEPVSRILLLSGCCALAVFLFAGLFV
jgi:tryptophan-rich sensory protein